MTLPLQNNKPRPFLWKIPWYIILLFYLSLYYFPNLIICCIFILQPVADSSTGLDLNNLPVVFASNQDDMISKSPQISKRPGAKSLSFKQMTLSNNLKVISPKTGDKVLTTKINQPSEAPMNQQRDLDMNNLLSPSFLSDAPLSRKKSLLQESPAARGTGRERKVNPKYDTAYTDGAELDLDSKPAVGTPKKPASAKKQDRRRSNEKKNPGNR